MRFPSMQAIKVLLNPGVLVELCLVFPEFLEEVLIDQARVLSEMYSLDFYFLIICRCAEEEECLLQQKSGEDGTER